MTDGPDADEEAAAASEAGLRPFLEMLSSTYNFDFREYKEPSLARRIRSRMSLLHVADFAAYTRYLDQHPDEHVALFNAILINVTSFFRDPEAWHAIAADVIPRIVEAAGESRSIRIWSAGCSSGEEPYSVAMLLAEHLGERVKDYVIKIYGTDVDEEALAVARPAAYRLEQLRDVPPALVDRYFTRDGQLHRIRRELRRWCIFGAHNLIQAPPLSHMDLLLCRNVLIYFNAELQERVLARFHYAICEGGVLVLGRSESLMARSRLFRPLQLKWRIFERTSPTQAPASGVLPERAGVPGLAGLEESARADGSLSLRAVRALDALPAAVMVVDTADTVLTWNPAAEALFDLPAVGAVAHKFRDLDVSYRVEGLRARIEEVKTRRAPVRMENATFSRRDGQTVHSDISILPLFDAARLVGVAVFALEATEHARLKEQMTRVAEQHATAIEELQSTNEELETTNEELQSTNEELETTNEELQSTNEELETTVEELQAANAELATLNSELESRTADLNRLDVFHRSLINSLEAGLAVLNREGVVVAWNEAAEVMWGVRAEKILNRRFAALPIGEIAGRAHAAFERVLANGEPTELHDVPYALPGGSARRGMLRIAPLRDPSGAPSGVIAVMMTAPPASP